MRKKKTKRIEQIFILLVSCTSDTKNVGKTTFITYVNMDSLQKQAQSHTIFWTWILGTTGIMETLQT